MSLKKMYFHNCLIYETNKRALGGTLEAPVGRYLFGSWVKKFYISCNDKDNW